MAKDLNRDKLVDRLGIVCAVGLVVLSLCFVVSQVTQLGESVEVETYWSFPLEFMESKGFTVDNQTVINQLLRGSV